MALLVTVVLLSLFPVTGMSAEAVKAGDSFTYTKAQHWGVTNSIWSWQWATADSKSFSDMTFTTVDGQGEVYAADWEQYPYCAARNGGINVHPNQKADAARVFTAPASGWVTVEVSVARTSAMAVGTKATPTSFRILLENTTVYPSTGDYLVLSTTATESISLPVFVKKGERLRFIVGAMDNQSSDSVNLQTTITYDTVGEDAGAYVGAAYRYGKTAATWGTEDPHWSWEWTPAGQTDFSPMTWQYVEKYKRNMYASDWTVHPYNYVDSQGKKLHPAETADTVKTFTVPFTGTVDLHTEVARCNALSEISNTAANGTSLRILVNSTQVYPLYSDYLVLESADLKEYDLSLPVTKGDKIRIVIGGMGQVTSDAVTMDNTVTYTSLDTPEICVDDQEVFSATATQFANNDMGNWSFEYRDSNDTFGNMTYQYLEKYGRYLYASDWTAHEYNYVDSLGKKLHPAKTRDAVKTYTAPYDGRIEMTIEVKRSYEYVSGGTTTPTSLRVYKNNEQIWPANGGQKELTSATVVTYRVCADLRAGDKLRCVVGSMNNTTQDGVIMENTVTYRSVGVRELAAFMDQYNQRIDVIDLHGTNLNCAETVWSWKPTTALGFTDLDTFNSPTDAKLRYNKSQKKYVVAVCSSRGFMGLVDFATGKRLWQVSLTGNPNPHAAEYLPNGNVAVAASLGDWIRVYTASQGSTSAQYAEVTLEGAHGVLWDPDRKVLWGLGDQVITAYTVGGTAAAPTLTEVTKYRATLPNAKGHDLSPVYGNKDRLWISSDSVYQYDIPSKTFLQTYDYGGTISRAGVKGISNFPDSHTTVHVFANNTYLEHDSDRVFVTLTDNGKFYGITHSHATGAYYKVRSWLSAYNASHKVHTPVTVPGKAATCADSGLTDGKACSLCGITLTAQKTIAPLGHNAVPDKAVEATCTGSGLTEGSHCSACNAVLTPQEVIPATGHSYVYKNHGDTTHLVTCQACKLSEEAPHSFTEGLCICGEEEHREPVEDPTLKLNHSLNLASDISVNLLVSKTLLEGFDMDTVYIESTVTTYSGNEVTGTSILRILPEENGNYYYFTLDGLTAVQMNHTISSVLYGTKEGQPYYSPADQYSIATYAYSQLNKASATDSLKALCAELLRYGTKAQSYKGYRTDAPADGNMTDLHKAYLSDLEAVVFGDTNVVLEDLDNAPITWAGKSLNLESKVALKFMFNTAGYEGDPSALTLHVSYQDMNGKDVCLVLTDPEVYRESTGVYAFTVDTLLAAELRRVVSVQIYAEDTPLSPTLQYSPDTYGNKKTGTLLELCKALMAYSDTALAFFGQ